MSDKTEKKETCTYCRQERDPSEMVSRTIIYQGRNDYGKRCVLRKTGRYCKDKGCGGYDQMAHEG